jgi:hypothetical protein
VLLRYRQQTCNRAAICVSVVGLFLATDAATGCAGHHPRPPASRHVDGRLAEIAATVKSLPMEIGAPPPVIRVCREAEQALHRKVTCPRLVPKTRVSRLVGSTGLLAPPSLNNFYALTFNTGGDDPTSPLGLHWIFGRGSDANIKRLVLGDASNEVKGRPRHIGTRTIDGVMVELYRFPGYPAGGPFGSHTLALVRKGRAAIFASVHGYLHLDASIAIAVSLALQSS